jgi:3'-phosphoadenosine 5'-phosphosulfate sulfotransferase (PAPS reductase)/FAD synthetase/signal recognition particle receptor subunit beta
MDLLKQTRVAFVGIPDAGKSTLIATLIKYLHNKVISPDTLMNEVHYTDGKDIYGNNDTRTIRAAKILCPFKDYELMLIDCPGHLEYADQIQQGLELSSIIVCLIDANRIEQSYEYSKHILATTAQHNKHVIYIHTHAKTNSVNSFESNLCGVHIPLEAMLKEIDEHSQCKVDIEKEALLIAETVLKDFDRKHLMFSGGKDSIVGYDICNKTIYRPITIWPKSSFDFQELETFINDNYSVTPRPNIPPHMNYINTNVFDIHEQKGEFNIQLEQESDLLIINYRASDEGVRSKDHYVKMGTYCHRFSPVFYFSEENIWRYIAKHNLKYPSIYNKGYRSLGDEPVTLTSMPETNTINEIIDYVHNHPFEERNGRKGQDESTSFGMEKLRNKGFF